MGDSIEEAKQSIDEAVEFFLNKINTICENGPYRESRRNPTTFPMLGLANDEFYQHVYFERVLEGYVRDHLINVIFCKLFSIHNIKSMWSKKNKNYIIYNTESIENIFPFEFIIVSNEIKIGVRYTSLCADEAAKLKRKCKVKKILQIKWDDKLTNREKQQKDYDVITPADFFKTYLSTSEYEIFLSKVLQAVEAANAEIGFDTIPRLSLRYLSNFKAEVSMFLGNTAFDQMHILKPSGETLSSDSFSMADYEIMNRNFQQRGLYKALLGTEGFAKCFITAEYQFQVFKQGYKIDYTSVICGYLKAVEQLIYKLLLINLDYPPQDELWIKCNYNYRNIPQDKRVPNVTVRQNPHTGKKQKNQKDIDIKDKKYTINQVIFKPDFKDCFDISLVPMIWFIHDNEKGWEISDKARETIRQALSDFAKDCRNGHFHKDNIDDFNEASRIRNNAILIFYYLLGGYKLTGDPQKDMDELGIEDDSFDRLYKSIQKIPRGIIKFVVYFDGREAIKAYRHYTQDPTVYDNNGSVAASEIKFVAVDQYGIDEYDRAMRGDSQEEEFTLSKDNMPERVSYINVQNEEVFIDW